MPKIKPKIESKTRKFETNPTQKEFKLNNEREKRTTEILFFIFFLSVDELANEIKTTNKRKTTKKFQTDAELKPHKFLRNSLEKESTARVRGNCVLLLPEQTEWGKIYASAQKKKKQHQQKTESIKNKNTKK